MVHDCPTSSHLSCVKSITKSCEFFSHKHCFESATVCVPCSSYYILYLLKKKNFFFFWKWKRISMACGSSWVKGLNLCHSSDPNHYNDNTGSLSFVSQGSSSILGSYFSLLTEALESLWSSPPLQFFCTFPLGHIFKICIFATFDGKTLG